MYNGGPDNIPNWVLKEYSFELAQPLCEIINSSLSSGIPPEIWKCADVTKVAKVNDILTDLRPISLTPTLSKVAEHLIVEHHVKPAVLQHLGPDQFGCIPKSSTAHALINMIHNWTQCTDGKSNKVRAFILDFKKAFDLIDHTLLMNKLQRYGINPFIINWICNFLKQRQQRVKLSNGCFSEWKQVHAGVPQGTKLGSWLFIVMINDLHVPSANGAFKYVDDTTLYEVVSTKNPTSSAQTCIDEIQTWTRTNKFTIHPKKCKELRISFLRKPAEENNVIIDGIEIKPVNTVKILGVTLQNDLKWNSHVQEVVSKAAKRLYFLTQLKRASVDAADLIRFYTACIRSVLMYACQVFHYSLPEYLSATLERIQKRSLKIIYGYEVSYKDALNLSGLLSLHDTREEHCRNFFNKIITNKDDKLYKLLPFNNNNASKIKLRKQRKFLVPRCKTNRHKNSFIIAAASSFDQKK